MTRESNMARTRLTGALVAFSAVGLVLAGCGSSDRSQSESSTLTMEQTTSSASSSATSPAQPPAPPPPPSANARGRINSLSGSTVALAAKTGPTTVVIGSTTRVFTVTPGQLTDVQSGVCAAISRPAPAPGAPPPPAKTVTVSAPNPQGACPQSVKDTAVNGKVTAVNGKTISVDAGNGPTDVSVDPATQYQKQDAVSALAITPGACLAASGPLGPDGALQANSARIVPPVKGVCPGA